MCLDCSADTDGAVDADHPGGKPTPRLEPDSARRDGWQQRQAHGSEANLFQVKLAHIGLSPEQVLSIADYNETTVSKALDVLIDATHALQAMGRTSVDTAAIRTLRTAAVVHAGRGAEGKFILPAPQGVTSLPAQRPADFDIVRLSADTLVQALRLTETNSNPVSGPQFDRPADPLFNTWFETFAALGTRALTMSEMQSMVRLNLEWRAAPNGERLPASLPAIKFSKRGLLMPHELHLFAAGFRAQVGHNGLAAGQGGEYGLVARATLPASHLGRGWGDEAKIRDYWGRQVRAAQATSPPSPWAQVERELLTASTTQVAGKIEAYVAQGFFSDPRDQQALRATTDALLSSAPNSTVREQAARALIAHFQACEKRLDTVSVSGATAEVQMLQTLSRYLSDNHLSVQNPLDKVDVVQVYRLYRTLLANGELTSRATVEGWLVGWGVAHAP